MGGIANNYVWDSGASSWVPQTASGSTSTATHTTTSSTVGDSASSVTLLAANSNRIGAAIRNDSTATLYIELGGTASTASVVRLTQHQYYELPVCAGGEVYRGIITGIWDSDAGGNARVSETVA